MVDYRVMDELSWADVTDEGAAANISIVAAPGAGKRIVVYTWIVGNDDANVILFESPAGTRVFSVIQLAGTTQQFWFRVACPENAAVVLDIATGTVIHNISLGYKIRTMKITSL